MSNFDHCFERLLGHEGGYSAHPGDPGGETMWGITFRVARANGYAGPMRQMPVDAAKSIYRRMYWDAVQADKLPPSVRFDVFDAAVNSGVAQAAKWLQRSVGVTDDGVIGPATIAAAHTAGVSLLAKFNGQRLEFMAGLPAWPSFGRGWARRIAANLQAVTA